MIQRINLVQNDTGPPIIVDLLDRLTWDPVDVSNASTVVTMKFFATGSSTVLTTITAAKLAGQLQPDGFVDTSVTTPGAGGRVSFSWPNGSLNVAPGTYEGEISIVFNTGITQTIFDNLRFYVRDDI